MRDELPPRLTPAKDDDQKRRRRLPVLGKEQSWRTTWIARSHRLVLAGDAGPFTDPDGFVCEAATR
jgi:hypothetical protein